MKEIDKMINDLNDEMMEQVSGGKGGRFPLVDFSETNTSNGAAPGNANGSKEPDKLVHPIFVDLGEADNSIK